MNVVFGCPSCGRGVEVEAGASAACRTCGGEASLPAHEGELAACLVCGCEEIYRHRDFNVKLGIALIVLGVVLSLALTSFLPLVVAAALDLALYFLIPDVGICYRCKAHYRDFDELYRLPAFDLERHERYRFERARKEREAEAPGDGRAAPDPEEPEEEAPGPDDPQTRA